MNADEEEPIEDFKRRKIGKWERVKVQSISPDCRWKADVVAFTRTISAIYLVSLLDAFTHIQLSLLGRYIYVDTCEDAPLQTDGQVIQGTVKKGVSQMTEKKFLSMSWYLLNMGWRNCVDRVEMMVTRHLKEYVSRQGQINADDIFSCSLKEMTDYDWMKNTIARIRDDIEYNPNGGFFTYAP